MLKIRLFPKGKKHQRSYRIVVAERRSKLNGKFIDDLGYWLPQEDKLNINLKSYEAWIEKGAQATATIKSLIEKSKSK